VVVLLLLLLMPLLLPDQYQDRLLPIAVWTKDHESVRTKALTPPGAAPTPDYQIQSLNWKYPPIGSHISRQPIARHVRI
jgi:hypothetical protein